MSVLGRAGILGARSEGRIVVTPWDDACLRVDSYDVHLSPKLMVYTGEVLDCANPNPTREIEIPPSGLVLMPGELYLGSTIEYTETHGLLPYLDGKSSCGRLGLFAHVTAGRGDAGFCGNWTLELTTVRPLRVYAGMPVGQLVWHTILGGRPPVLPYAETASPDYAELPGSHYAGQGAGGTPVASRMYANFPLAPAWLDAADALRRP